MTLQSKRWDEIDNGLELDARLRQFEKDSDYLDEHYQELLHQFPDEFVAIYGGSVAAHGTTLDEVERQLAAHGVVASWPAMRFLSSKRQTLLV